MGNYVSNIDDDVLLTFQNILKSADEVGGGEDAVNRIWSLCPKFYQLPAPIPTEKEYEYLYRGPDGTRDYLLSKYPINKERLYIGLRLRWNAMAITVAFKMHFKSHIRRAAIRYKNNYIPFNQRLGPDDMYKMISDKFIDVYDYLCVTKFQNLPKFYPESQEEKDRLRQQVEDYYVECLLVGAVKKLVLHFPICIAEGLEIVSEKRREQREQQRKENARTRNTNNNAFQVVRAIDVIPYLNRNRNRYLIECSRLN